MKLKRSMNLVIKVLPYVALIIAAKLLAHRLDIEIIPLNAIFSAMIGANVFLIGFLISGVLADYKESEKLPGELSGIFFTLADEINFTGIKMADGEFARERLKKVLELAVRTKEWLHKKAKTRDLMLLIEGLSDEFVLLEKYTAPNYVARLKQEQNNLRKIITRIHTIRETDFIFSGYFIASTTTNLLILGMVFLKIEPFYESLFFVGLVTYLLFFLLKLIRDLDNPFGYYEKDSYEDVSIKPIDDAIYRLTEKSKA
jgi:predicted membrane chloride channel (bestrophin family)